MGNNAIKEKARLDEDPNSLARHEADWDVPSEESTDPDLFVVLFDYQSEQDNQLSIRKGDKVQAQSWDETMDWCLVTFKQKSGYVPTKYIAQCTSLEKYPWYHGPIPRSAADYILRSEVEGAYLVRESTTCPGQFCVSLRHDCSTIHYKIIEESGKFYLTAGKTYNSLPELIKSLTVEPNSGLPIQLNYSVPKKNKPTIYDVCPGIPDKWEMDRSELELFEKLGSGQYGDVYRAKLVSLKKMAAIKTLKDVISEEEFVKEAALMKTMKHPNLVQLLGVCSKRNPIYIVMEFLSKGNLLNFLRCALKSELTPTVLLYMANQIASAMTYLESKNFIHRDLAARNCLVGEDHLVKVADFGLARVINEETYTSRSSPMLPIKWTAPEGLAFSVFSSKSDVWAFGVLLYEMVTYGKVPYPSISIEEIYPFLESGGRMESPPNCPPKVYQLMRRCWEWDVDRRPTFKEVRQELEDINCQGKKQQVTIDQSELKNSKTSPMLHPVRTPKKTGAPIPVRPKPAEHKAETDKPLKAAKSNSVGESAKGEGTPSLSLTNELLQKINQSDPCKSFKATKQIPSPTKHKPHAVKQLPPIPMQPKPALKSPPLPPNKPTKENSLTRVSPKVLFPPTVPLKPWQTNDTKLEGSVRPSLPLKPHSR